MGNPGQRKQPTPLSKRNPQGFSLIELVVVLFVLTALAGVGVTAMQGMSTTTHGATDATMIARLDNAMRTEEARQGAVGAPGFDTLIDTNGDVADYLMGSSSWLTPLTLDNTATTVTPLGGGSTSVTAVGVETALQNAGITEVYSMIPDASVATADATFDNVDTSVDIAFGSATVALLTEETGTDLNLDPASVYVVFGLGKDCDLTGDGGVLSEAPVFMPRVGSSRDKYSNLMVIYRIPETGMNPDAQYVGAGMPMMSGILNATHHVKVYHEGRDGE